MFDDSLSELQAELPEAPSSHGELLKIAQGVAAAAQQEMVAKWRTTLQSVIQKASSGKLFSHPFRYHPP